MKILKGVLNSLIAFILSLAILANFLIVLVSNTILKEDYMLGLIEENGYYEKIETDLKNGFEEYRYQSGLPEEVFENLYTSDELKKDINSIIRNLYNGTEITNHAESVKIKIAENVNQYLTTNQIALTEEQQKNIDEFKELIVKVYEDKVNSVSSYVADKNISDMVKKVESVIKTVKLALFGGLIFVVIVALCLNIRTIELVANVIGSSLLASGMLLELFNIAIRKNIDIEHILLFTQSFSDLMKYIIYDILSKFNFFGIICLALGIVMIIINNFCIGKKDEYEYEYEYRNRN